MQLVKNYLFQDEEDAVWQQMPNAMYASF